MAGADSTVKVVVDHAHRYNYALSVLTGVTAVAAVLASITDGWMLWTARLAFAGFGVVAAVVGVYKVRNERRYKDQEAEAKESLDEALKAEERRVILLLNGALLDTALKLKDLPMRQDKDVALGGFRTSVVNKVCELVRSNGPRAAYFKVEDIDATPRTMTAPRSDMASRNREDTFSAVFVEGEDTNQGVWELIDRGDTVFSNDITVDYPPGWDSSRSRTYRSFASVPVRVGEVGLGMLTANTLEKDGFGPSDLAIMKVLANLLAVAELVALSSQKQNALKSKKSPAARQPASSDQIVMLNSEEGEEDDSAGCA